MGALFPVEPEDVPDGLVHALRRTLLRQSGLESPGDDELARLIGAVVLAWQASDAAAGRR